jgi:MATE family multidrug resistance protein
VALAYWAIGLPAGIVLGFVFDYGLPGIWAGMLGAVCVHCASYVVIWYATPC